jgi:SAM-dependent methyltransferase
MGRVRSSRHGTPRLEKDRWRDTYERTPYQSLPWFDEGPSPHVELAVREKVLSPPSSVLDIGCGAGSNVLFLARSGFVAHGIDLAPGAVATARQRAQEEGLTVHVQEGDALTLPFPDRTLDGAVDNGCFHTIAVSRRPRYAREVARVLRPGGAFLLGWIGRETTTPEGPPHRPSLMEVTTSLEPHFVFLRTWISEQPLSEPGSSENPWTMYYSFLRRRKGKQPPPR